MRKVVATEFWEQVAVVNYLEILKKKGSVKIFSAVPNNTYTKSWNQKRKQKMEGVRPGVPDLIIVTKRNVLFLEMKKRKGGVVRDSQKEWLETLEGKRTVARVARGAEEAIEILKEVIAT